MPSCRAAFFGRPTCTGLVHSLSRLPSFVLDSPGVLDSPVVVLALAPLSLQQSHARWITLSFGATQTVAGILMAVAVLFTLTGERFSSLRVCCNTSQRVKFREFCGNLRWVFMLSFCLPSDDQFRRNFHST